MDFLKKLFDTSKKELEQIEPLLPKIAEMEATLNTYTDEQIDENFKALRAKAMDGESLDNLLVPVFAYVREVSKRLLGMRQFDVQLLGGIVLHQGKVAEMRTGEGKTLVAVAPLVLNAMTGRGVHLVTVNDYLARRDAVWMGPIYHRLGFTVGIIQGQSQESDELGGSYIYEPNAYHEDPRYMNLVPCSRQDAYGCDIVYGTNHEFGFDYLRDNMAFDKEDLVMRELNYAMIDEVDSILIDEAKTPHIISGPSMDDVSIYKQVDALVSQLEKELHYTVDKKSHVANLTEEGMDEIERLLGIDNIASDPKMFHYVNAAVKAYGLFDKDIDYVVRKGEVILIDENTGHMMFGRRMSDGIHQALEAKEQVPVQRESQTIATITFQNLFRLYNKLSGMTGTAKTEEDEFRKIYGLEVVAIPTHRPMIREDHSDVIYKSNEAKLRGITWEILRVFTKQQPTLVGTRSIEMSEVVSARLKSDMLQKMLIAIRLREMADVKKELKGEDKKTAIELFNTTLDDLNQKTAERFLAKVGVSSDFKSPDWTKWFFDAVEMEENEAHLEAFTEAVLHGVPHNVLNAKYHEREAVIIAEAGRKGQVTIATNMAGRGVDILLGGRVEDETVKTVRAATSIAGEDEEVHDEYAETYATYRRGGKERAAPPLPLDDQERRGLADEVRGLGGLFILGCERHESRRIDNQLRGRSGRQGDPGESRFFVSLEDTLWKTFNPNLMDNPMLKAWPEFEEVRMKMMDKMILKTQERIENHFYEYRKQTLEYDDVLNAQREDIYGMRRDILLGQDCREEIQSYIPEIVSELVDNAWVLDDQDNRLYDYSVLFEDVNEVFPLLDVATVQDLEQYSPDGSLKDFIAQSAIQAYDNRIESLGEEVMRELERRVMLHAVNERWMEHLQTIDYIREGIGLRGYGQVDPLIAYKKETFDTFLHTKRNIHNDAVKLIFRARIETMPQQRSMVAPGPAPMMERLEDGGGSTGGTATAVASDLGSIDWKRIGRNDPCPCGSGKKFKACHYPELRAKGEI